MRSRGLLVVAHGGAGSPNEHSDGPQAAADAAARQAGDGRTDAALRAALEGGIVLEDDPRFNAGTGATMRIDGTIQMDAILAASDGRIGSVAGIERVRNPLRVARLVIDSPHVMLAGDGATAFARKSGFPVYDPTTEEARTRHREAMERLRKGSLLENEGRWKGFGMYGTIGVVVRGPDLGFAVASSTGGTPLMLRGRVGDTPIFGAGVMCGPVGAVAATGDGEEVIRRLGSFGVYTRIAQGEHPQTACETAVREFPRPYAIGFIAVSVLGYGMAATNDRMARAVVEA